MASVAQLVRALHRNRRAAVSIQRAYIVAFFTNAPGTKPMHLQLYVNQSYSYIYTHCRDISTFQYIYYIDMVTTISTADGGHTSYPCCSFREVNK